MECYGYEKRASQQELANTTMNVEGERMLEERDPELLDCKITLFSKTYLRGKNFSLDVSNTDTNDTLSIKDLSKGNTKYDTICCINACTSRVYIIF